MAFNTMEHGGEVSRVIPKRSDNQRINPFHAHTITSTISSINAICSCSINYQVFLGDKKQRGNFNEMMSGAPVGDRLLFVLHGQNTSKYGRR